MGEGYHNEQRADTEGVEADAYGDGEPELLGFAPGQAEHGVSTRQDDPGCGDGAAATPIARTIAVGSSRVRWTRYAITTSRRRRLSSR